MNTEACGGRLLLQNDEVRGKKGPAEGIIQSAWGTCGAHRELQQIGGGTEVEDFWIFGTKGTSKRRGKPILRDKHWNADGKLCQGFNL